ncbi:MAG: Arc family DNA-binding protein [Saprospiraceae bacterium]|nr:Arc family DNA-binding protein [Saprospiraceae bacterium]
MAEKKSFVIRIKPEMYDALERWAADEFRSVNGQIEYLLDEAIKKQKRYKSKFDEKSVSTDLEEEST